MKTPSLKTNKRIWIGTIGFALLLVVIYPRTAPAQNTFPTPTGIVKIDDRDGGGCCAQLRMVVGDQETHLYSYGPGYGDGSFQIHKYGPGSAPGAVFTILKGGNIGIGTTTPAAKLDIAGMGGGATPELLRVNNGYFNLKDRGDGFGSTFRMTAGNSAWDIYNVTSNGSFRIYQLSNAAGTGIFTERLVIDQTGNVGIGTTGPTYKLDVNGEINATGLRINGTSISTGGSQWTGSNSIYYNGNVGIGTAGPASRLQVQGNQVGISVMNNASTQNYYFGINDNDGNKLYIGRGRDPSQGMAPAITVDTSDNVHFKGSLVVDGNINAKYQDVAEWVPSSEQLAAGTVVVLDQTKSNQVVASTQAYDTRVAGVISAQPGITLGEKSASKVLVATTGRVRVKVDASWEPIAIGDLLVTSDVPGVAMKSEPVEFAGRQMHMPGTIIGKALEPLAKGKGEILVLLSLQ